MTDQSNEPLDETAVPQAGGADATEETGGVESSAPAEAAATPVVQDEGAGASETAGDDEQAGGEQAAASDDRPAPRFKRGDVVKGKIAVKSPLSITVDLGEGLIGEIMSRELERMTPAQMAELEEGADASVFVVNPRTNEGKILLSLARAAEELDWRMAEEYRGEQRIFVGAVAGFNKGGLIVRFGRLRGFVPLSQMSDDRRQILQTATPQQYDSMVNQNISVKVMEVNKDQNRLILSERMANRENREKRKDELINRLNVGQVLTGKVVSLEDFGAFVDVGGAEGLVHLTELSWKHVTHAKELLKVGQEVKVEVISIDPERKRIGLSIKRTEEDPWDEVASGYVQGQLVRARITKLTKFGAFARLVNNNEIEGLVHISELSDQRVNHPKEVVNEGDTLTLRVIKIDIRGRRLGLSLKRVNSAEYLDVDLGMRRDDE
ncbi:MAG: S1 RNA-binding domain-containing protein [Anaerolineae bacterium]|jgi:small subunit ribosomal protein S1|nr:S1 RNA-binding domain-containing protein [Anaerolineae bacterium]